MSNITTAQDLRQEFAQPIQYYDIHVYFNENDPKEVKLADDFRKAIKERFPTIKVFDLVPRPVGPHPIGMFELHLYNPVDFSQVVPWILMNRGQLKALLHPNTHDALADHSTHAMWFGEPVILDLRIFNRFKTKN